MIACGNADCSLISRAIMLTLLYFFYCISAEIAHMVEHENHKSKVQGSSLLESMQL